MPPGSMHEAPRQALRQLLSEHGRALCADPVRCEALLRDRCGQYRREIFALISALKERVVEDLESSRREAPPLPAPPYLAQRLRDHLGLADEVADWAVGSWALALAALPPSRSEAGAGRPTGLARTGLPALEDIHGWLTDHLQALQQRTAQALGLPVTFRDRLQDGSQGPAMVVLPAGRFLMGSPKDEWGRRSDERQHRVTIERPFALGQYPVAFDEFDRFAAAAGQAPPQDNGWGRKRRPVIQVNWDEALAYANWLSAQTGKRYRLPTEAEWEYAARAGATTPFNSGDFIKQSQANYERKKTTTVGQFPPNAWGLHDMHGNVWEWTGSMYDEAYANAERQADGAIIDTDSRVLRGGSWRNSPASLRSAFRAWLRPQTRNSDSGFRVAREL